jgi:hypothetical protein
VTEIQNPKQKNNRFEPVWNWRFICNLVLGICDFRHKTPRQSQISLTWPKGPGFLGQNNFPLDPEFHFNEIPTSDKKHLTRNLKMRY